MHIFLTTEFTNTHRYELISLALVAETGAELYVELSDYCRLSSSVFVKELVEPHLGLTPTAVIADKSTIRAHVAQFLAQYPGAIIACNDNADWWLLTGLLLDSSTAELFGTNVNLNVDVLRQQHYYARMKVPRHHALHSARALKDACTPRK